MYYIDRNRPHKIINDDKIEIVNGKKFYLIVSHPHGIFKFPVYETSEQAWDYIINECEQNIQKAIEFKQQMIRMKEADLNYEF